MVNKKRIGVWLIGAWGGVSTAAATGLAALQNGATGAIGLVSELPQFEKAGLADWSDFVIGGHEIRRTSYVVEARNLHEKSRVFDAKMLKAVEPTLADFDRHVRTGTLVNVGKTISSLAATSALKTQGEPPRTALSRISADLAEFKQSGHFEHVIVVNVASTEPPLSGEAAPQDWAGLMQELDTAAQSPVPASSIYAIAAMCSGCSYVNFTPSTGSDIPALYELALEKQSLHMGRDGKTGETLLKSVLAPMFAARNLQVMSWVGHNIFGNLDGRVLDDPENKAGKVHSKDHVLRDNLGYKPQSHVSIEFIESLADWKTAWDHIHFLGFLNTPMTMQFTWQGCDSLLAAPLVLDLIRFTEREWRRGKSGVMSHLSSFFKSPMATEVPQFQRQFDLLGRWADEVAAEAPGEHAQGESRSDAAPQTLRADSAEN